CTFNGSQRRNVPCPRRAPPTQRRAYDNTLGRMLPGNLGFEPTRRQFLASVVSCLPDLGQEIVGAVAVENQLGRLWRFRRGARVWQERLDDFPIWALDRHRTGSEAQRLDPVVPGGKLDLINDEV